MSNTTPLPTDRNGQIYYGPKTYAEAEAQIRDGRPASEMADMMEGAGYTGIAARIRREYAID